MTDSPQLGADDVVRVSVLSNGTKIPDTVSYDRRLDFKIGLG